MAARPAGLPPRGALAWIHGIGAGVAYLHERGIVHRDLKPGNIFCDEGVVKVGDYGLSKFISCSRRSGHTESIGTVHYMAPEVANGRYGKEIDIYALGVMLYEMLTGRLPFEGESVGEVLMKHLTAKPDVRCSPSRIAASSARAMEKDPDDRFRSADEMMAALDNRALPDSRKPTNSREQTNSRELTAPGNTAPFARRRVAKPNARIGRNHRRHGTVAIRERGSIASGQRGAGMCHRRRAGTFGTFLVFGNDDFFGRRRADGFRRAAMAPIELATGMQQKSGRCVRRASPRGAGRSRDRRRHGCRNMSCPF